ncbi:MAG: hypothetical protein ACI9LX_000160 [Paraglaciecola sp.]|jgi:hypothetical protein
MVQSSGNEPEMYNVYDFVLIRFYNKTYIPNNENINVNSVRAISNLSLELITFAYAVLMSQRHL